MRELIDIVEMLNSKADVKWSLEKGYINKGKFTIDGDLVEILIEEFETASRKSLVEFGFSVNGSIQAKEGAKNKSRLIGSVLNGAIEKIEQIDPDVVLVAVNKKSGMIESRKAVYTTIMYQFMKRSAYLFHKDWIENSVGFYAMIAKHKFSEEEEQAFINMVKSK